RSPTDYEAMRGAMPAPVSPILATPQPVETSPAAGLADLELTSPHIFVPQIVDRGERGMGHKTQESPPAAPEFNPEPIPIQALPDFSATAMLQFPVRGAGENYTIRFARPPAEVSPAAMDDRSRAIDEWNRLHEDYANFPTPELRGRLNAIS